MGLLLFGSLQERRYAFQAGRERERALEWLRDNEIELIDEQ